MNPLQQQIIDHLSKHYAIREAQSTPRIVGGTAVVVTNPKVWGWGMVKPYAVGIVGGDTTGNWSMDVGDSKSITFAYSAFKDKSSCSCSGGPATIGTPFECLRPTGLEIEINFWKFKNDYWKADNAEYYKEFVHLYEWYQSEEDARVKEVPIDKQEYDLLKKQATIPVIDYIHADWQRDEKGELLYWYEASEVFALPQVVARTPETIVAPVIYKMTYKNWSKDKQKWEKVKPSAYFRVDMLLYDYDFKKVEDLSNPDGRSYKARSFYMHAPSITL